MFKHWELVKHLALREVRARYKQSFLGFFWVVLNPFFQMLIMSFIFSNIIKFSNLGTPYPVFLYAGLLPWIFLASSLTASTDVLVDNAPLLKKIYFPREILVMSTILAKTFDFALSLLVFAVLMVWFKIPFTLFSLFVIPIFLIQFLFVFGFSLILSALNLFYRDVKYLFSLILTLWFYLTPVLYSTDFFPQQYRWIFRLNPMSVYINAYRQVIFSGSLPNFASLGIGILVSLVIFIFAYRFFKKMEGVFADIV